MYHHNLIEVIRERVRSGLPYMGVSAGTNMACPTLMTTNDMPIVQPPSFQALDLVPYQVNPHYFSGPTFVPAGDGYQQHFGETRDDRHPGVPRDERRPGYRAEGGRPHPGRG